ncbi:MAG: 5-formyltetrahydrofolate cyclo-ligase [Micromonosporaceae bacterium]|nr:5-formyltetrahydrofolate cyclo-ligase [Micromonosporaceae bacterium]
MTEPLSGTGHPSGIGHPSGSGKRVLRESLLAARVARSEGDRARADAALIAAARRLVAGAARVAAYAPMPGEPGGPTLPDELASALPPGGLLLPALRPDRDLDWVAYTGTLAQGGTIRALREPPGPRLGLESIATAEIVFVPALAVDRTGARLGRGGGSYDRALTRVRPGVPVIALLYEDELVPAVPTEPHDRPVTAALTPDGLVDLRPPR